jgi:hypothetical protein
MLQESTTLPPEKRKLIEDVMETKKRELHKVKIADLKWLNSHYGCICTYKKKDLVKNLLPLRNKFCKLREILESDHLEECPVCLSNIAKSDLFITNCAHVFCNNCIIRHIIIYSQSCPICRSPCTFEYVANQYTDSSISELLHRNGIIKITQSVLDTGLVLLEDTSYSMRNRFIWDRDLIQRIVHHTNREKRILVLIILIIFINTIFIFYPILFSLKTGGTIS